MKRFYLLTAGALLLAWGCSKEEPAAVRAAAETPTVPVEFRLEADVDSDSSLEPMTRATNYTQFMSNECRMLVLKRNGQQWIVDTLRRAAFDASMSFYSQLELTGGLPSNTFRMELRPGDYRIVAVLNALSTQWNNALVPGTVVADEANPRPVPPLLQYIVSTHEANTGYRMLNREIFVAVTDFSVPKSDDLHGQSMPRVTLEAQRRVAKLRLLLKNRVSPVNGLNFIATAYKFHIVLRTKDHPFPLGIDALGDTFYGEQPLYELPWCLSTLGGFHLADNGASYLVCHRYSTVFSPFLLADPHVAELPVEVGNITVDGQGGGDTYFSDGVYPLMLAPDRISGIVFQIGSRVNVVGNVRDVEIEQASDEKGVPENAAKLFDQYFEWNAPSDKITKP